MIFKFVFCGLIKLFLLKSYKYFIKNIDKAEKIQKKILLDNLHFNRNTEYGKKYSFKDIKSVKNFQELVPITCYEDYEKYIEKVKGGQDNILFSEKLKLMEPTSGSTGKNKFIPYNSSLQKEFNNGIFVWLYDLINNYPNIIRGKSYWSITPITNSKTENSEVRVGFEDDSEYIGFVGKLLKKLFVVPSEIKYVNNIEDFKILNCAFMFASEDLAFISAWNATFLINLLDCFEKNTELILEIIKTGKISLNINEKLKLEYFISANPKRAKEIETIILENGYNYKKIFPNLSLVSVWGDSNALEMYKHLARKISGINMQKKGLLSTECIVSFPFAKISEGHVISYLSHFYEFEEVKSKKIVLIDSLEKCKYYNVIVTTRGGLYRYRTDDIIMVVDFYKKLPIIQFIGREKVTDLCGEKLNEIFISNILADLIKEYSITPRFYMLAPEKEDNTYRYVLYIETEYMLMPEIEERLEEYLKANFHYNYCRKIGQLEHSKIVKVENGNEKYYNRCIFEFGQKIGDIKNTVLSSKTGWNKSLFIP